MAIRPQAGPQEAFFANPAQIVIYGGSAGGGKTWALCAEPLRHINVKGFSAVIFRRNLTQVTNPGGLWDEAQIIYGIIPGAKPRKNPLQWNFSQGTKVQFAHLANADTVLDWQGSQIALIEFDELTHFTRYQFFYMVSRNRSTCGVMPYIRASCNPDADSWVAEFIEWWIDQETGFPIEERAGVIRYFVRDGDNLIWGDSREELEKYLPDPATLPPEVTLEDTIKSVTFIPSKITDNKELLKKNPAYYGNLLSLPRVERERLLGGNWKVRPAAGMYFRRSWCEVVDVEPADMVDVVRYWDLAATEKREDNDPDYTVGVKMGKLKDGRYIVLHCHSQRTTPHEVKRAIKNIASQDGDQVRIGGPVDPGAAGKFVGQDFVSSLDGYDVHVEAERASGENLLNQGLRNVSAKVRRFSPFSSQAEAGNVLVLRGDWNDEWFSWLEALPEGAHDDHADATSGAHKMLAKPFSGSAMIEVYKQQLAKDDMAALIQLPEKDPLPWRAPAPAPVEDSNALDVYQRAITDYQSGPQLCKKCGKPVGDTKVSDGVDVWHPQCA